MSGGSRGHTIAGTFPIIVRLIVRFLYRSAAASRSTSSPRDLASIDGGAKLLNGNCKIFPTRDHIRCSVRTKIARDAFNAFS